MVEFCCCCCCCKTLETMYYDTIKGFIDRNKSTSNKNTFLKKETHNNVINKIINCCM